MKILSLDTASDICSVCLLENDNVLLNKNINDKKTHSEKLMPLIKEVLDESNLNLTDIDLLAVNKGPGSFTGIRIGISTVKAFSDTLNIPALGISSLESLANNINLTGLVAVLIDAKNDNVYYGLFKKQENLYIPIGDFLAEHISVVLDSLSNFSEKITFLGNGSIIHKDLLHNKLKENAIFLDEKYSIPNAISIGKSAYYHFIKTDIKNCNLSPMYLKKSQAERALEDSHGN